jgi:uncharacterized membrane protein YkvA (DUF1232 family)
MTKEIVEQSYARCRTLKASFLNPERRNLMDHSSLPLESDPQHKDFYIKLRDKITTWYARKSEKTPEYADYVLMIPDFFYLLVKLTLDNRVPAIDKAKFAGVIAYVISPVDFVPEALFGPLGYLDDLVLACYVLNLYINQQEKANQAIVGELWPGNQDVLATIQSVLQKADKWIGSGALDKLKMVYETFAKSKD